MPSVSLTGQLRCRTSDEVAIVRECLPAHILLTRAEPGCLKFEVQQTLDPLIWQVQETFADQKSFDLHQARAASSEWGRVTANLERRYTIKVQGSG